MGPVSRTRTVTRMHTYAQDAESAGAAVAVRSAACYGAAPPAAQSSLTRRPGAGNGPGTAGTGMPASSGGRARRARAFQSLGGAPQAGSWHLKRGHHGPRQRGQRALEVCTKHTATATGHVRKLCLQSTWALSAGEVPHFPHRPGVMIGLQAMTRKLRAWS